MSALIFKPFSKFTQGIIFKMLMDSYASQSKLVELEKNSWENFDKSVFENLDTVGKCGFVSTVNGKPVGFASWDPRDKPGFAIIGQNCVLPKIQRKGYGKNQVKEVLRRLKILGFKAVKVSTGSNSFFSPARKMYKSCGFKEVRRTRHSTIPNFEVVHFEKKL